MSEEQTDILALPSPPRPEPSEADPRGGSPRGPASRLQDIKSGRYVFLSSEVDGLGRQVAIAEERSSLGFMRQVRLVLVPKEHPDYLARKQSLRREAAMVASFKHPRLAQFLGGGEEEAGSYVVFDHVEGTSLERVLAILKSRRSALPADIAVPMVVEALRAVHQAHGSGGKGVVFRGLAPRDITVSLTGDVHVTLVRFPRKLDRELLRDEPIGHVAPECLLEDTCSPRSDVYSLGVILAELLIGHECFSGTPEEQLAAALNEGVSARELRREGLPEALVEIILRAAARRANARFESARAMAEALEEWLADAGHASSTGLTERFFAAHRLHQRGPSSRFAPVPSDVPPLRLARGRSVLVQGAPKSSAPPSDLEQSAALEPEASPSGLRLQSLGSQLLEMAGEPESARPRARPASGPGLELARPRARRPRRVAAPLRVRAKPEKGLTRGQKLVALLLVVLAVGLLGGLLKRVPRTQASGEISTLRE